MSSTKRAHTSCRCYSSTVADSYSSAVAEWVNPHHEPKSTSTSAPHPPQVCNRLKKQLSVLAAAAEQLRRVKASTSRQGTARTSDELLEKVKVPLSACQPENRELEVTLKEGASLLGFGALGQILLCTDNRSGDPIAVKVASAETSHKGEALVKLEYATMALLDHPHIVKPLGWCTLELPGADGEARRSAWGFAMPVMPSTLSSLLWHSFWRDASHCRVRVGQPLGPPAAALAQVAAALEYLHVAGVAHGDVKPPNVLIDPSGAAQLCDFSSAVASDSTLPFRLGTEHFMAPERTAPDLVPSSDILSSPSSRDVYALGVATAEWLAGEPSPLLGDRVMKRRHLAATGECDHAPTFPLPARLRIPRHSDVAALFTTACTAAGTCAAKRPTAGAFAAAARLVADGPAAALPLPRCVANSDTQLRLQGQQRWLQVERQATAAAQQKAVGSEAVGELQMSDARLRLAMPPAPLSATPHPPQHDAAVAAHAPCAAAAKATPGCDFERAANGDFASRSAAPDPRTRLRTMRCAAPFPPLQTRLLPQHSWPSAKRRASASTLRQQ